MKFEWDERKNQANIKKHELDFIDAHKVFEYPMLINMDDREEYGEDRWIAIGLMDMRVVIVVFTGPEDTVRVISFRKATSNESTKYAQAYKNQFKAP